MERHDRGRRPIGLGPYGVRVSEKNFRRDDRPTTSNLLHKTERTICEPRLVLETSKPGLAVGPL